MNHPSASSAILALALALGSSAAMADAAPEAPKAPIASSGQGAALLVSLGESGGMFSPGASASFRVFNASPQATLTGLRASASSKAGFKVASTTCPAALAPRRSCSVSVVWNPQGPLQVVSGSLTVSAVNASGEPISVSAGLTGDVALPR